MEIYAYGATKKVINYFLKTKYKGLYIIFIIIIILNRQTIKNINKSSSTILNIILFHVITLFSPLQEKKYIFNNYK